MTATTYTARHAATGTEFNHTSRAKKAPTHFVIVYTDDTCSNVSDDTRSDLAEPAFMAYRSSKKAAESEALRWLARYNTGSVKVDVIECAPK